MSFPRRLVRVLALAPTLLPAQPAPPTIVSPEEGAPMQVAWPSEPGTRYVLEQSGSLGDWAALPGYPATARGAAMAAEVDASSTERFWRVVQVDQQPPTVEERYPEPDAFGIAPNSPIVVDLADQTGIDAASVRVHLPGDRTFSPGDPALSLAGNRLVLDLGSGATLGAPGDRVTATVTVADTLGHVATHAWSFDLAPEPEVAEGVFVLGSPAALAAGQLAPASPLIPVAPKGGAASATSGTTWSLAEVLVDRLVIAYAGGPAPSISTGALLANAAPTRPEEIFYRRVIAAADDAAAGRLTLTTEDAPLEAFLVEGAVSIGPGTQVLEVGDDGRFLPPTAAFEVDIGFDRTISLPDLGFVFDGATAILRERGFRWEQGDLRLEGGDGVHVVRAAFRRLSTLYAQDVTAGLEIRDGRLLRSELVYRGDLRFDLDVTAEVALAGVEAKQKLLHLEGRKRALWFLVGGFPVAITLNPELELELKGRSQFNITYQQQLGYAGTVELGYRYRAGDRVPFTWVADADFASVSHGKPPQDYQGTFELELELKTSVNVLLYGTGGAKLSFVPSAAIVFDVKSDPELHTAGKVVGEYRVAAEVAGIAFETIDPKPALSRQIWTAERHLFPTAAALAWVHVPAGTTIDEGNTLRLEAAVNQDDGVTWRWTRDGVPVPGQARPSLVLPRVRDLHSGSYRVLATRNGRTLTSPPAVVIVAPRRTSTARFAFIPPGSFLMGSPAGEPGSDGHERTYLGTQRPTTITRGFFMERFEVTWGEWERVWRDATGGLAPSQRFAWTGNPNIPVYDVLWWEAVAFCNLRSQLDDLRPAYYRDPALTIPLSGPVPGDIHVDWNAPGYRLPTEAEWEYACRAGSTTALYNGPLTHLRVSPLDPNLDRIAWYYGNAWTQMPVGLKEANAFGLHDMLGNVFERIWDGYGPIDPNDTIDPRGPAVVQDQLRVTRGGAYSVEARYSRSAWRSADPAWYTNYQVGFRTVRGLGP